MSDELTYDYIVIGGGSAGSIVAGRLAEEGRHSVLLLEAGEPAENNPEVLSGDGFRYTFANDALLHDRLTVPQEHSDDRRIFVGTGRGMGGSGSINGTVYTRGDKLDFEQWPEGWRWDDNLPFYERLEARLEIQTQQPTRLTTAILEAAKATGFTHKDRLDDGHLCGCYGYETMNNTGVRRSSYVAFVKESNASTLEVRTLASVRGIEFNDARVSGVKFRQNGKDQVAKCSREVVFCAGALETPKLLMLAGIGPRAELEKFDITPILIEENIGKNLQDHPGVNYLLIGKEDADITLPQLYGFDRVRAGAELPEGQADVCFSAFANVDTMKSVSQRFMPYDRLPRFLHGSKAAKGVVRFFIRQGFKVPKVAQAMGKMYGLIAILGKPLSRGTVTLASKDPAKPAAVDPNYYAVPEDMETLVDAVLRNVQISKQPSLVEWGNYKASRVDPEDREAIADYIRKNTNTNYHFVGTCSMGDTDDCPVDTRLRLKGFDNVRIADASAIPVVPVSATNAPTMMLAYRAAEFIMEGAKGGA